MGFRSRALDHGATERWRLYCGKAYFEASHLGFWGPQSRQQSHGITMRIEPCQV